MSYLMAYYNGIVSNIPEGWQLCDGSNGFPNLEDMFIKGEYDNSELGQLEGSDNHTHTPSSQGDLSHTHETDYSGLHTHTRQTVAQDSEHIDSESGNSVTSEGYHNHVSDASVIPAHTHTLGTAPNDPSYFKLAVIGIDANDKELVDIPQNSILMWNGDLNDLPSNFKFCDGSNGTPDLRNKYIKGVTSDLESHKSSIESAHQHSLLSSGHTHSMNTSPTHKHDGGGSGANNTFATDLGWTYDLREVSGHNHVVNNGGAHTHSISDEVQPKSYKLAYIMKVA